MGFGGRSSTAYPGPHGTVVCTSTAWPQPSLKASFCRICGNGPVPLTHDWTCLNCATAQPPIGAPGNTPPFSLEELNQAADLITELSAK